MGTCGICGGLITIWEIWTGSAKRLGVKVYHVKCLLPGKKS